MGRSVVSLNGEWHIRFDPENVGNSEGWFHESPRGEEIVVPSVWNEVRPGYEGVAWYSREFALLPEAEGRRAYLRFGAVNYLAEVWLNGQHVGSHEGGYTPFLLPISPRTSNILWVRVLDPDSVTNEPLDGIRHAEIASGKEAWTYNFSGIWQDVSLLLTEEAWIGDDFIEPRLGEGRAVCHLEIESASPLEATVEARAFLWKENQAAGSAKQVVGLVAGMNRLDLPVELSPLRPWSPEEPALYRMELSLSVGERALDQIAYRFGMREFTVRENRFYLNGKEVFLRGVLNQQVYPRTLGYPASEAAIEREVESVREAGFNFVRMYGRPAHPCLLDLADEKGLLLYVEPAICYIAPSPELRRRCETEVAEMVRRDRNHPSIVIWGILNETSRRGNPELSGAGWLFDAGGPPGVLAIKEDLCLLARTLDPTRLIVDDSGGWGFTQIKTKMYLPYSDKAIEYDDLHAYRPTPYTEEDWRWLQSLGTGEELLVLSEIGCHNGWPDLPSVIATYDQPASAGQPKVDYVDQKLHKDFLAGLEEVLGLFGLPNSAEEVSRLCRIDREAQVQTMTLLLSAVRANPKVAGFVVTQQADAAGESSAGLFDIHRCPKPVVEAAKTMNADTLLVVAAWPKNIYPGGEARVQVTLADEGGKATGQHVLSFQLQDSHGQVVLSGSRSVQARLGGQAEGRRKLIFDETMRFDQPVGAYRLHFCLGDDLATGSDQIHLWPRVLKKGDYLGAEIVDPEGRLSGYFTTPEHPSSTTPILVAPLSSLEKLSLPPARLGGPVADALEKARAGATVVFLELPPQGEALLKSRCWCEEAVWRAEPLTPRLTTINASSHFLGFYHYVPKHPIFEGLPTDGPHTQPYARVSPTVSVRLDGAKVIAGTFRLPVTWHTRVKRCRNADRVTWGADICELPYGRGRVIVCQFRITGNLFTDPIADILLRNLIRYAST